MNHAINLGNLTLKNPVITASGTCGFGRELSEYYALNKLGGLATKGLTFHERKGNDGERLHETPSGLMNSIGLQNPSVGVFLQTEWAWLEQQGLTVLVNVGGSCEEEYLAAIDQLESTTVEAIELNISCPNVKEGGMAYGMTAKTTSHIVSLVRKRTSKMLIVKLSPNGEAIAQLAKAAEQSGADAISLVNTFQAMAISVKKRCAVFDNVTAGLSGAAIFPIALRMVRDAAHAVSIPVIGMGGIMSGEDAIAMIMAGATAVQIGTATLLDPLAPLRIIQEMEQYARENKLGSWAEIRKII